MTLCLPPNDGPPRDEAILKYIQDGNYEVSWATITHTHEGHSAEFWVLSDALKIEGVRINVSAELQQKIADLLESMLPTPMMLDLMWVHREVTLPPFPRGNVHGMSSTQAMLEHSYKIDAALSKLGNPSGLISTLGKSWCLDQGLVGRPGKSCNFGWHFTGKSFQGISGEVVRNIGTPLRVIQGRGFAHDKRHTDYSQVCVLVSQYCVVDGEERNLIDILQDPVLSYLASYQGPLTILRQ